MTMAMQGGPSPVLPPHSSLVSCPPSLMAHESRSPLLSRSGCQEVSSFFRLPFFLPPPPPAGIEYVGGGGIRRRRKHAGRRRRRRNRDIFGFRPPQFLPPSFFRKVGKRRMHSCCCSPLKMYCGGHGLIALGAMPAGPPPLCVCTALSETPTTPFLCAGVGLHARAVINRQRQVRKQRAHHDSLVPYKTFSLRGNEKYLLRSMYNNKSHNWDHYFLDLTA